MTDNKKKEGGRRTSDADKRAKSRDTHGWKKGRKGRGERYLLIVFQLSSVTLRLPADEGKGEKRKRETPAGLGQLLPSSSRNGKRKGGKTNPPAVYQIRARAQKERGKNRREAVGYPLPFTAPPVSASGFDGKEKKEEGINPFNITVTN